MDSESIIILLSVAQFLLPLFAWLFPESQLGQLLRVSFGPIHKEEELRSSYLLRLAGFSLRWLYVLAVLFFLLSYALIAYSIDLTGNAVLFFIYLANAIGIGMAVLSMFGCLFQTVFLKVTGRDYKISDRHAA